MGLYFVCWFPSLFISLLLAHWAQMSRLKKGKFATKSSLSCRSRWAIILAGTGVVSFMIPLYESELLSKQHDLENAIRFDALQITYWDRIEEREFIDTIYPRAVLDTAENDFRDYNRWMENNAKELLLRMDAKKEIRLDSLYIPAPKTEIGTAEISFYRNSFIGTINDYNQQLEEYNETQNERESLKGFSLIVDFLMPILLLIAMVLQFNGLFWEDHLEDKPGKPSSQGEE